MTFYVGQKVVCVRAGIFSTARPLDTGLSLNAIYTVRKVHHFKTFAPLINVEELPGDLMWAYCVTRFRPLDERPTDISIFTEILDRVNGDKPRMREEV